MKINNIKNILDCNNFFLPSKMKRGYTLLELLFYISIFSIISLLAINAMITMTKAFKETTIQSELADSGLIMERMSREIRKAYNVNTISSNDLKLDTTNDAGANKTIRFLFSGSNIEFFENDVLVGNLNSPDITISALTFSNLDAEESQAIRIFLTVRSNNDLNGRSVDFYNTVVLRGSY